MTDENTPDINQIEEEIRRLEELKAKLKGSGAIAQGENSTAIGQQGVGANGSVSSSLINTGTIFQVYQEEQEQRVSRCGLPSSPIITLVSGNSESLGSETLDSDCASRVNLKEEKVLPVVRRPFFLK